MPAGSETERHSTVRRELKRLALGENREKIGRAHV